MTDRDLTYKPAPDNDLRVHWAHKTNPAIRGYGAPVHQAEGAVLMNFLKRGAPDFDYRLSTEAVQFPMGIPRL